MPMDENHSFQTAQKETDATEFFPEKITKTSSSDEKSRMRRADSTEKYTNRNTTSLKLMKNAKTCTH